MSKKKPAKLSTQSQHWFITIRKNIELPTNDIKLWVELYSLGEMYAFIEHKGDISKDTGEVEGTHYHIVMDTQKRVRKLQLLKSIVSTFKFDNPFGIEVDTYDSFEGCLQYLTHQNDHEKTPHDRKEIITNIDKGVFDTLLDTPIAETLTTGKLCALIEECDNPVNLCERIGLGTFDHYLKTIRLLWRYLKGQDL